MMAAERRSLNIGPLIWLLRQFFRHCSDWFCSAVRSSLFLHAEYGTLLVMVCSAIRRALQGRYSAMAQMVGFLQMGRFGEADCGRLLLAVLRRHAGGPRSLVLSGVRPSCSCLAIGRMLLLLIYALKHRGWNSQNQQWVSGYDFNNGYCQRPA
jgi:hypothetical protein